MAKQQQKGADQTEKPTAKKLRDARKEGNVHKSKELSSTVLVLLWLLMATMLGRFMYRHFELLFDRMFLAIHQPFDVAVHQLWQVGLYVTVWVCLPMMLAACFVGLLVEFLQVGPVMAFKRIKPEVSRLNPVEGIKRMFSQENLVELVKSILKTGALVGIFIMVVWSMLDDILRLPLAPVGEVVTAHWRGLFWIGVWTVFVFFFVSVVDAFYQRFVFIKNLRMSRRDIKQEVKENEGDPLIKGKRRQLHQEWAQQNMMQAARTANVVVTNPTHIAIALTYEDGKTDLPVVTAKGEDHEAMLIRKAAEEAGVPIMRNVALARGLHEHVQLDDYISSEFFDAVAELLLWAESIRRQRHGETLADSPMSQRPDDGPADSGDRAESEG